MSNEVLNVAVDKFKPRWYQIPVMKALEVDEYKQLVITLPRRSGKDVLALNCMIRQAFKRIGAYYYIFPRYAQSRKAIFEGMLVTGEKFLDFIPDALIKQKHKVDLKVELINGSIIQFQGSDKIDSLRGTNPLGIVFSEFAYTNNPEAYDAMRPILANSNGWVMFISTPNGRNIFYDLMQRAKEGKGWYYLEMTAYETGHMTAEALEKEKEEMSEQFFAQEYLCSFDSGIQGSWYAPQITTARHEGRISFVPYDPSQVVYTCWDIGVGDPSFVILYQLIGNKINIFKCIEEPNKGLEHFVSVLDSYNYIYKTHIAPHDIEVREWGNNAITRRDKAKSLGIEFELVPRTSIINGIEQVRTCFNRIWIDENNCVPLIRAIENYHKEFNKASNRYNDYPKKDWTNHGADALRYLCISLPLLEEKNYGKDQLENDYNKYFLGRTDNLSPVFNE